MVVRIAALRVVIASIIFVVLTGTAAGQIRITNGPGLASTKSRPAVDYAGSWVSFTAIGDLTGEGNARIEIYLHATATSALDRVTTSVGLGRSSNNGSISADGNVLVFSSDSDMLFEGRPQNTFDIWMYRRDTKQLTRLTDSLAGGHTNRTAERPDISADGRRIVFHSNADLLGQGGFPFVGQRYVWLYEVATQQLRMVTAIDVGGQFPSLSGDGRWAAFSTRGNPLGGPISEGSEIWLCDLSDFTFRQITDGSANDGSSGGPSLNADGTRISFTSYADLLSEGQGVDQDIWLYDVTEDRFTRISNCASFPGVALGSQISPDGSFVVFESDCNFDGQGLGAHQANFRDLWRFDIAEARLTRLTKFTPASMFDSRYSDLGPAQSISGDGRHIVFESDADLHNDGLPQSQTEIWMFSTFPPGQDALAVR